MSEYFSCPHCGEEVKVGSKACPHCGSDKDTGWNEDSDYNEFALPNEDEYEDMIAKEFGGKAPSKKELIKTAVIGAVALLIGVAMLLGTVL